MFGDQGTIQPLGFAVAEQVKRFCLGKELCDAAQVVGDLAYAWHSLTLGPELELLWDIYQNEQEQYASRIPMMTTVGNHELFDDAIAYRHRFSMPGGVSGGYEEEKCACFLFLVENLIEMVPFSILIPSVLSILFHSAASNHTM